MLYVDRGSDESERCLPAKTRRRSDSGAFVRRARRDRRVPTDVDSGIVRGNAADHVSKEMEMGREGRWSKTHCRLLHS
jgi:hypothetical protein